jgi:hypothetical protein
LDLTTAPTTAIIALAPAGGVVVSDDLTGSYPGCVRGTPAGTLLASTE